MKIDFPEGVKELIRAVREELKAGKLPRISGNADEDAAEEIMNRIRGKAIRPDNIGLDPKKQPVANPVEALKVFNWAAKQYFMLLLIDLGRFNEQFQDHESCVRKENLAQGGAQSDATGFA